MAKENLLPLTAKEEKYCLLRYEGYSKIDAYRGSYDASKSTGPTCSKAAWTIEQKPKIRERIKELREIAREQTAYTLGEHVQELKNLAQEAKENGNYGAAVNCLVNVGKACGLYTENISVKSEELAPAALISQIRTANPAMADMLEQSLGLNSDNVKH